MGFLLKILLLPFILPLLVLKWFIVAGIYLLKIIVYILIPSIVHLINHIKKKKNKGSPYIFQDTREELEKIDRLDGIEFEYYISNLLKEIGFLNVEVSKASNDYGVDIVASKDNYKYAFQCKRYSTSVNNTAVQEVVAGMNYYNCNKAVVVTNNYFTQNAIELARFNNVELWDRDKLISLIEKIDKENNERISHKGDFIDYKLDRVNNMRINLRDYISIRNVGIGIIIFVAISILVSSNEVDENTEKNKTDTIIIESDLNEESREGYKEDIEPVFVEEKDKKTLEEKEYWKFVDKSVKKIIRENGFVIYNEEHLAPYMRYYVTSCQYDDEGKYMITRMPYEEYKEAVNNIKESLKQELNKIKIDEPKSIFHYPKSDILALSFFASDIKNTSVTGLVPVGSYQIRIIDYYYGDEFTQIDHLKEFEYK